MNAAKEDTITSKPLISVIIPVYNTQDYIGSCLQSVLDQTYPHFEILCMDDGSTDSSKEIIRRFMEQDSRIRLIEHENHGQGYERNRAMEIAVGEYVQFLDSDDYLEPSVFEECVQMMKDGDTDLVMYDWQFFDPETKCCNYVNHDSLFQLPLLKGKDCHRLLSINPYFTVNKLYRRSFLIEHEVKYGEGYIYEDIIFSIRTSIEASKVLLLPKPYYRVTVNPGSTTKVQLNTRRHAEGLLQALQECGEYLNTKRPDLRNSAEYDILKYFFIKFISYYYQRTPKSFRAEYRKRFLKGLVVLEPVDQHQDKILTFGIQNRVFSQNRMMLFHLMVIYRGRFVPLLQYLRDRL